MKTTPFASLNAEGRRFATTQEIQQGYPCGPADQSLFNGQWYRLESEIGHVIEFAGIVGTDTDLTQLRQAIQQMILSGLAGLSDTGTAPSIDTSQFILIGQARTRLPIFPEIFTPTGKMGVTSTGAGNVRVPAGVTFQHRGIFPIATLLTDFVTLASKTYHVRWNPTDGFQLKDLADIGYNPTVAAETDTRFDTTYDDMLVARVITSAGNIPTITDLVNKDRLRAEIIDAGAMLSPGTNDANRTINPAWNWSRKPMFSIHMINSQTSPVPGQNLTWSGTNRTALIDMDYYTEETVPKSRYGMQLLLRRDMALNMDVNIQLTA